MATPSDDQAAHNRLEHFPISFFASVMGMLGLTLALHAGETSLNWHLGAAQVTLIVAALMFVVISALYALKAVRYPRAVAEEWMHPIRIAFFPAISISLLLFATAVYSLNADVARWLWLIGAFIQGILTLFVVTNWIGHRPFQPIHLGPAWFIPAVGNIVVPLVGARLGYVELSWYFFSTGMIFWIILLTLVMNRLVFHDPLPGRLQPTLVILIAPPAIAFLAYLALNDGKIDHFAHFLINVALLFAAIVLMQAPKLAKLPFALSFWALSFPVAALSVANLRYSALTGSSFHQMVGLIAAAALVLIILGLVIKTIQAALRDEICVPE